MKTIKVNYSKTFEKSTASAEACIDTITECFTEQVIKSIFGENNELISNVAYLDTTTLEDDYVYFRFDVGGLVLCAKFTTKTSSYNTILNFNLSIETAENITLSYITGAYYYGKVENDTDKIISIVFNLPYSVIDGELKAIWSPYYDSFKPGVIVWDSIDTFNSETKVDVIGVIGSAIVFYQTTSEIQNEIDTTNRTFVLSNNVLIERIPYFENKEIIGFLKNIVKMYNSTLGTNSVTAEGSYRKLIEVDGVRYRQLAGPYWIEDKD